jgi:hypothetical protein
MGLALFKNLKQPQEVIDITYSVQQTFLGNYFFGQTDLLTFGGGYNAWGGLINPVGSGVDMFWNVYTISNFSSRPFTTEAWLNSTTPGKGTVSINAASANQAIIPLPRPKVELQYTDYILQSPTDGIYSFLRRVEPNSTLTRHDFQGLIIIPPGGSAILFLRSPDQEIIRSRVAFGWWEQKSRRLL